MPLANIGSYTAVVSEHVAHWEVANADPQAPPGGLVLPGGYAITDLEAERQALYEASGAVIGATNGREEVAGSRDTLKRALLRRMAHFRAAVKALVDDAAYVGSLPVLPDRTSNQSKFLAPFHDMAALWERIDADTGVPGFTPPLTFGGYTRADLAADIAALQALAVDGRQARTATSIARGQRDELLRAVKRRLQQYRVAVVAVLGPDHALVGSLPRLSPRPGSTPKAVALTASWDAEAGRACLAWTASEHTKLAHYSVRACNGERYHKRGEWVVGHLPKEETTFSTEAGLPAPGAAACYRVYVVASTGNERGSNAVVVRRPG